MAKWLHSARARWSRRHSTHYKSLSMETLAVGVSLLTLGAALLAIPPVLTNPPLERARITAAFISAILGAVVIVARGLKRTPVVEIERQWNERFDELRNDTDWFMNVLSANYEGYRASHPDVRHDWKEYLEVVPLPNVRDEPLHEWAPRLSENSSADAKQFFAFMKSQSKMQDIGRYRRSALRVYDDFGRLLMAERTGFREWMEREGIEGGGNILLVILAYLQIAKAADAPLTIPGKPTDGFWFLVRLWFPRRELVTMRAAETGSE